MKKFNILTMEGFLYSYAVASLFSLGMFVFSKKEEMNKEEIAKRENSSNISIVTLNTKIFNPRMINLDSNEISKNKTFPYHKIMSQYAEKILKNDYLIDPNLANKLAFSLTEKIFREWKWEKEAKQIEKESNFLATMLRLQIQILNFTISELTESEKLTLNISNFKKQETEVFHVENIKRNPASKEE